MTDRNRSVEDVVDLRTDPRETYRVMRHHSKRRRPALRYLVRRGWLLALLAATLAGGAFAAVARADGDPASDYLLTNRVFLASGSTSVSRSQRQLLNIVRAANRDGVAIRVAIISTGYDLGSITELWRKPRLYARFLGLELSLAYKQRLLVVMPNGFGFNWPRHSVASAYRLLAHVVVKPDGAGLADAAQTAVRRLASASGVTLTPPAGAQTNGAVAPSRSGGGWIIAAAVVTLAVALALLLAVRRGRRARLARAGKSSVGRPSRQRIQLRWAVPAFALLCSVAVAAPILAVQALRNARASSNPDASSEVTRPPYAWPAGRRPAPEFVLRDQGGRRVSIAAYRGRPVILTFVDPLCRNLCPLEAKLLNQVVGQMPASQRPEILAVSVDVYANARKNLLQDDRQWALVPQWRWAVGRPSQLAAVWKQYKIGVSVVTRKIARTTIKYITHTEGAYIIDRSGHERALFLWPFYPQDVEHVLRELT